jgi:ATP-dependent Clp protease protease subunit
MANFNVMQLVTDVTDPTTARMTIYGDISRDSLWTLISGEEDRSTTDALAVADAISALPPTARTIEVHINSYGGDVSEGVAIYNALRDSGREVVTVCDGFACSIASVVFMAGSRRIMRPASLLMLHNPLYQNIGGNSKQLRKAADDLDTIAELSKSAYLNGTNIDAETLDAVMDAETWVSPQQALDWGLATEIEDAAAEDNAPTQAVGAAIVARLADQTACDALMANTVAGAANALGNALSEFASSFDFVTPILAELDERKRHSEPQQSEQPAESSSAEPIAEPTEQTEPTEDSEPHGYARLANLFSNID